MKFWIDFNDDQYEQVKMHFNTPLKLTKEQMVSIDVQDAKAKLKNYEKMFLDESTKSDSDYNLVDEYKKEIADAKKELTEIKKANSKIKTEEKVFDMKTKKSHKK